MPNILVVVVSCHKHAKLWEGILSRNQENTLIVCGGFSESTLNGNMLQLQCSDDYEGLSEKMMCTYEFILNNPKFNEFTHILKADDHDTYFTSEQIKDIQIKYKDILEKQDYIGQNFVPKNILGRHHHFGRISKESIWHNKEYSEEYKPYLGGGETYILSRKALECLVPQKKEYPKYFVYEDAMTGALLYNCNIHPYELNYGIKTWKG
jgi:hypothetical protein